MPRQIMIVIGASAGGVAALKTLVAGLPPAIPASICIVQHIGRHQSILPDLLAAAGALPAVHPEEDAQLAGGRIYIAPPDYHLLIVDGRLHLSHGPRENFTRPAIDPLFRSAAATYSAGAIGVILSGSMSDGMAGLYEIKQRGGIAVVQTPDDAAHREMPANALAHVEVDYCMPVAKMPALLARLTAEMAAAPLVPQPAKEAIEMTADYKLNRPAALTCPDCGGAIERQQLGTLTRYVCHIGHAYTGTAMATAQFEQLEKGIEAALRLMNERIEVCRQMAERPGVPDEATKAAWLAAMEEAEQRADAMGELLSAGWLSPEE